MINIAMLKVFDEQIAKNSTTSYGYTADNI